MKTAEEIYQELQDKEISLKEAEKQMEECVKGNVAIAAYGMCRYCGSSREWAERQIQKGIGDVAIERGIGDVAMAAYKMCKECGSSRKWAEEQIERGLGNVAIAAYDMCKFCGSSKKWAKKLWCKFIKKRRE